MTLQEWSDWWHVFILSLQPKWCQIKQALRLISLKKQNLPVLTYLETKETKAARMWVPHWSSTCWECYQGCLKIPALGLGASLQNAKVLYGNPGGWEGLTLCGSRVSGYNISLPAGWLWEAEPQHRRSGQRQRNTRDCSPSRSLPKMGQGTGVGIWEIIVPPAISTAPVYLYKFVCIQTYV